MNIAAALAAAKNNAGLTQTEAARRLGADQSAVSFWESEKKLPRASMLVKLADLYCCTIDELMGRNTGQNSA